HGDARQVLEDDLRELDIGEKRRRVLLGRALVRKAVARELMAAGDDAADEFRIALGDPAEREKRGMRAVLVEHLQDAVDVRLDASVQSVPLVTPDVRRKR